MSVITARDVIQALTLTCKMTGFDLDDSEKQFYLKKLKGRISGEQTICALDDLMEKGKKPTLANILAYEVGGYDQPEIAYAKAVASLTDESQSCLMNDCIAKAWQMARPLYEEGMKFEANKAFVATYNESVLQSKQVNPKPVWWLSLGTDKEQRVDLIRESVSQGLISQRQAQVYLPHLSVEEIGNPALTLENKNPVLLLESSLEEAPLSEEDKRISKAELEKLKNLLKGNAA